MRILHRGTPKKTIYKGTCHKCETVFEAEASEVKHMRGDYTDPRERDWYAVACPVCHAEAACWPEEVTP